MCFGKHVAGPTTRWTGLFPASLDGVLTHTLGATADLKLFERTADNLSVDVNASAV
jgi:hypothetical protein